MLSRASYRTSFSSVWPTAGSTAPINTNVMKTAPAVAPTREDRPLVSRLEGRKHRGAVMDLLPLRKSGPKITHRHPARMERTNATVNHVLAALAALLFLGLSA